MRRLLILTCNTIAWAVLLTSLPGVWLAGFFRGLGLSLRSEPRDVPTCRYHGAVLTESDVATLIGTHEAAIRRGEARWQ